MSDWLISIAGTEAGHRLALGLALSAAVLHALFGALQKGRHDPWLSRAAIDGSYALLAAPVALFVVPWPEPHLWPIFGGMLLIHIGYKIAQGMTYDRGAYTVVYPVVRGMGPLITMLAAGVVFGERYTAGQWAGVALLVAGIFGLALLNLRTLRAGRETLRSALLWAMVTGCFVAAYTTYDAWGIRQTANPFTFLAWFFFLDGLALPLALSGRLRRLPASQALPLLKRGVIGALVAFASFGSIMLATRIDTVGQAAVLRETSTVFAALIGWLVLGEKTTPGRVALMALIAAGAVVVEWAG